MGGMFSFFQPAYFLIGTLWELPILGRYFCPHGFFIVYLPSPIARVAIYLLCKSSLMFAVPLHLCFTLLFFSFPTIMEVVMGFDTFVMSLWDRLFALWCRCEVRILYFFQEMLEATMPLPQWPHSDMCDKRGNRVIDEAVNVSEFVYLKQDMKLRDLSKWAGICLLSGETPYMLMSTRRNWWRNTCVRSGLVCLSYSQY